MMNTRKLLTLSISIFSLTMVSYGNAAWASDHELSHALLTSEDDKDEGQDKDSDQDQNDDGQRDDQQRRDDDRQGRDDGQRDEGQNGDDGQSHADDDQEDRKPAKSFVRVDCRFHNDEGLEGIGHCYASSVYLVKDKSFKKVRFGVGCDGQTIYNDVGRIHEESLGERISPPTAAFPAVEIFPEGALTRVGTYESILDIREGRLDGRCYVHRLDDPHALPFD